MADVAVTPGTVTPRTPGNHSQHNSRFLVAGLDAPVAGHRPACGDLRDAGPVRLPVDFGDSGQPIPDIDPASVAQNRPRMIAKRSPPCPSRP